MEQDKFLKALAGAQKLILDDKFNQIVESKASGYRKSNNGINDGQIASLDAQVFGFSGSNNAEPNKQVQMIQENVNNLNFEKSKLPKAILESYKKIPPQTGFGSPSDVPLTATEKACDALSLKNRVNEQAVRESAKQMPKNGVIDYSLLKSIIDESVSKHIKALRKTMLNESSVAGIRLSNGNRIQMMDMKGNIYEGQLKLMKKANK